MTPLIWSATIGAVMGGAVAYGVMDGIADRKEQRYRDELHAAEVAQEKRNTQVVVQYSEGLAAITKHFRDVPVRVQFPRSPNQPGSPGCPDVAPKDVVFSGGKAVGGDGTAAN